MKKNIPVSGGLRTSEEQNEPMLVRECFEKNPGSWDKKLENFPTLSWMNKYEPELCMHFP